MKLSLVAVAFAILAAPAFAATPDASTMTCKDLMKMDAAGMASAGTALKTAMKADAKVAAMKDADVTKAAETACKAHPDAKVMDAMKM
jgi:hypothetical protein